MNLWRSAYESLKIISEPVCRVIIEIDWQYDISRDWKLKALFEQFNPILNSLQDNLHKSRLNESKKGEFAIAWR